MRAAAPRQRSPFLDNAKAYLITLVVFAHTMGTFIDGDPGVRSIHRLILVFHMPAFIFVTGYLSKPDAFTRKGVRSALTLAWAYLFFNLMNHAWAARFEDRPLELLRVVTAPSYALWFLLALFWWRLMLPVFAAGERRTHALASIATAVALAVGTAYLIPDGGFLSISRTFSFLPFFVAGFRAKQQGWTLPRSWWTRSLAVGAFAAVYSVLHWGRFIRNDSLLYLSRSFVQMDTLTIEAALVRLVIMATSAVLVVAFLQLVPRGRMVFSALGATTLSVYVWHAFSLRNIREFGVDELLLGTWWAAALTTFVMVVAFGFGPIPRLTLWIAGMRKKREAS